MPILRPLALALLLVQFPPATVDVPKRAAPAWLAPYRDATSRLLGEAVASDAAWQRLALLGDTFGHRLSGSPNLDAAIRWAVEEMKRDGLENVHTEAVKVPHWVRGRESLEIAGAIPQPLVMLGLGNSIGTPAAGIEAELVVVHTFEELDAARDRVRGRIVLFNAPFTTYGDTVRSARQAVARRGARRGGGTRARGRARRAPDASYGRADLRRRPAAESAAAVSARCRQAAADGRSRHHRAAQADDGGPLPSRRRLRQCGRRTPQPRAAGRGRRHRRPFRFLGRGHGIDGRWRRVHRDVGSAAADEEAEPPAAADGARGALDERGERRPRQPGATGISTSPSCPIT